MNINVTEFNLRNSTNVVAAPDRWPLMNLVLGGTMDFPFGISIFSGNYTKDDLSLLGTKTALSIFNPGPYSCPLSFK